MLEKIKKALRINNSSYDDEITDLINACKKDLELAGVASSNIIESDPMIIQAIKCYCKGNFGFDNNEAERFIRSYESLKSFLCLNYNIPLNHTPLSDATDSESNTVDNIDNQEELPNNQFDEGE